MDNPQIFLAGYGFEVDLADREVKIFLDKNSAKLFWTISLDRVCFVKGEKTMSILLTVDQKVSVALNAVDAAGNPAALESVAWEISDPSVLNLEVAPDDFTRAFVVPTGLIGVCQIVARADARFGPDVKELLGTLDVEVVAGEAVAISLTAGTPEPK